MVPAEVCRCQPVRKQLGYQQEGTNNSFVVGAHRRERSEYVIAPLPPVSTALIKRSDSASLNPKLRQS